MVIKVLGTDCANCKKLENHVRKAVAELGTDIEVVKVEDITKIIEYNVIRTPALIINEKLVMNGKVPSISEIKELIDLAGKKI